MAKKNLSSELVENNIQKEEKEVSVISKIRQIVNTKRIANAESEFIDLALKVDKDFTEEKFEERKKALKNFTIVFTRPSDEDHAKDMTEVQHDWNKVLQFGRKWFYKTQEISDLLSVARSYYSYDSYLIDKDNALKREAKKLIENMSKEELIKLLQANKQ
jgi:hypothetical protein